MNYIYNSVITKKSPQKRGVKEKLLPAVLSILVFAMILCLITNSQRFFESTKRGFMLFANSVFPGLFPFLVLTKILTDLGCVTKIANNLNPLTRRVFGVSGEAGYIFLMSALCGYPCGAKLTADLIKSGTIVKKETTRILSFCAVSGPIFTIGTVGGAMFGSVKIGVFLFGCHIVSALICGLLFCNIGRHRNARRNCTPTALNRTLGGGLPMYKEHGGFHQCKNTPLNNIKIGARPDDILGASVYSAVSTILTVGAFITLFYLLIDMVLFSHITAPIEAAIGFMLTLCGAPKNVASGVVCGIFEMTRGCFELSRIGGVWGVALTGGLLSFSGLSIMAQSLALLGGTGVSVWRFFLQKIVHALLCTGLCLIFSFIIF